VESVVDEYPVVLVYEPVVLDPVYVPSVVEEYPDVLVYEPVVVDPLTGVA